MQLLTITPLSIATGLPELNVTPAPIGGYHPKYQLLNSPCGNINMGERIKKTINLNVLLITFKN
jgi:hypothetical protein